MPSDVTVSAIRNGSTTTHNVLPACGTSCARGPRLGREQMVDGSGQRIERMGQESDAPNTGNGGIEKAVDRIGGG